MLLVVLATSGAHASARAETAGASGPRVGLSPASGPPGSTVRVSGRGFGAHKAVDLYFDVTEEAIASTNAHGAFSGITISVPATAVPGRHWITGVQRRSGLSAQAPFAVAAGWPQFRNDAQHSGDNITENVLSRSNVSGLGLNWSYATGGDVDSSPAEANGVIYIGSGDDVYAFGLPGGTADGVRRPDPASLHPNPRLPAGPDGPKRS